MEDFVKVIIGYTLPIIFPYDDISKLEINDIRYDNLSKRNRMGKGDK